MHGSTVEPLWGAQVKSAIRKVTGAGMLALTMLVVRRRRRWRAPVTLAEAQPWHYWIAWVLFFSALGVAPRRAARSATTCGSTA